MTVQTTVSERQRAQVGGQHIMTAVSEAQVRGQHIMTAALRPRILVADRGDELVTELRHALAGDVRPEIVHLPKPTRLPQAVASDGPWDLIVAGPSEESQAGLRRLAEIRAANEDVGLILTVNGKEPRDLQALVRARADELVRLPAGTATLRAAVTSSLAEAQRRRGRGPEPALPPTTPLREATVLGVGGPTGGSGKTMVAVNLAYLLAQVTPGSRVVLVDLDLQFGEVTAALALQPVHTIYDALYDEQGRPLDDTAVAEATAEVLTETPHGFWVLPASRDPVEADAVGPKEVARVLEALRSQAETLVLDLPTGLGEVTLAALDHTDHTVAVTQVDVPGIANLRSYLETMERLGVEVDQRSIVLNKNLPATGVSSDDAIAVLGPVAGSIPFDAVVPRALNQSQPLAAAQPDHAATRALIASLRHLLPDGGAALAGTDDGRTSRWPWRRTR